MKNHNLHHHKNWNHDKHLNNDNNDDKNEGKNTSMAVEVSDVSDSPAALQAVTLKQDDNDNE